MPELDDQSLETLLRDHLSSELDGQLGRCAAAFRRYTEPSAEAAKPPALRLTGDENLRPPRRGGRFDGWMFGLAGAALAASIAALWASPLALRRGAPAVPVQSTVPGSVANDPRVAEAPGDRSDSAPLHWVQRRTWNEGTVVVDDPPVPVQKVHSREWDHTRWYDPAQGAHVEMTVPHDAIKFVEMDTY